MTGVHHSILCFPLSLLEAEEANRAAALCSWEGEESTLLLPTVNEFRINEWVSECFFFPCTGMYSQTSRWEVG